MQSFTVFQGDTLAIAATIEDSGGNAIAYSGGETLDTTVWPGSNRAAAVTASTAWVTPSAGAIAITLAGTQTATLQPGGYEGLTTVTVSGVPYAAYRFTVEVLTVSGGQPATTRQTIVTIADAVASVAGFGALDPLDQQQLVGAATDALNRATARVLPLTTHDEVYAPELSRLVRLKQYPIVSIARMCAGLENGITISNTVLTRPTAQVIPSDPMQPAASTPVSLSLNGYTAGILGTPTVLPFATYTTIGSLAAAVNGLGSGWTAQASSATTYFGEVLADLPTTDIDHDWGTKGCKTSSGTPLRVYTRDLDRYDLLGNGSTGEVKIYEDLAWGHRFPDRRWSFSGPYGSVRTIYQGGYNADPTAGTVTMPEGLRRAALILIQAMYQRATLGQKTDEKISLAGISVTTDMLALVKDLYAPFRRREFA